MPKKNARKHPHPQPQPRPSKPTVDDFLVRRYQSRQEIEDLLRRRLEEDLDVSRGLKDLADEVMALNPQAQETLLKIYLEDNAEMGHLSLLTLSETPHESIMDLIDARLAGENIGHEEHMRLLMAKTFIKEDPETLLDELSKLGDPATLLGQMTSDMWKGMGPEEAATLWLDQFSDLEPEEKTPLFGLLLENPCPSVLAIAQIEAASGDSKLERMVAERLGDFAYPEAVGILERLSQSSDMGVRLAAEESLGVLRTNLPDLVSDAEPALPLGQGKFHKAYVARDLLCGQYSVIYSRKASDGSIRFCAALIDTWDQGLKDMWGNVCASDGKFEELVLSLDMSLEDGEDETDFQYEPAEQGFALYLLRRAEELTRQRGYDFPTHHKLWNGLYAEEADPPVFDVSFGLECLECGQPIRIADGGAAEMQYLIAEDFAICGECLKKKTRCANCGLEVEVEESVAIPNFAAARVDLFCDSCYGEMD